MSLLSLWLAFLGYRIIGITVWPFCLALFSWFHSFESHSCYYPVGDLILYMRCSIVSIATVYLFPVGDIWMFLVVHDCE